MEEIEEAFEELEEPQEHKEEIIGKAGWYVGFDNKNYVRTSVS